MTSVQSHYDKLLARIYPWMVGGEEAAIGRGRAELDAIPIFPSNSGTAVDLGAGFGTHAIPLAERGYRVIAIDSCAALLERLRAQGNELPIDIVTGDLLSFSQYLPSHPEIVMCMGDTITHLADHDTAAKLIAAVSEAISPGGRFIIGMRDYTTPLRDEERFITAHSDHDMILTCFLDFLETHIDVTDIVHERAGSRWQMQISRYRKVRLTPRWLTTALESAGFYVTSQPGVSGMIRYIATKN